MRKYRIALLGLGMGAAMALGGFVLAARAKLTPEYVTLTSAIAGLVSVVVGAFSAGNAIEHYSRKEKPDAPGDP